MGILGEYRDIPGEIPKTLGIWEWGDKGWCKGLGSNYNPGTAGLESVQTWWRTPEGNWRKVGSMNKKIAVNVVLIRDRWSRTFFVFLSVFFGLF